MRTAALLLLSVALASCDSAVSDQDACFLGAETEIPGDINVRITSPTNGDILRVGQPFRYRAEVEATGEVDSLGVQLVNGFGITPERVLFERAIGGGAGTYVIDEEVVLDSVRAGANRSEVYVTAVGRVLINTACGGGYGGAGSNTVLVTVID
jgi:hypothetical protein